jgi:muramoyltetrapeptide carboxypeptidase
MSARGTVEISAQESESAPRKPKALRAGSRIGVIAPASPGEESPAERGLAELQRLGFAVQPRNNLASEGYFASPLWERRAELVRALTDRNLDGIIAVRGGYGSNYLLDERLEADLGEPKCLIGYSDLTSLQIFLWQRRRWTAVYGPMLNALGAGADRENGYDGKSLLNAIGKTDGGWSIGLRGEKLAGTQSNADEAEGCLLGGCLTLVETTLGTPWELDTRDSILLLEDRGMKPWQVDRALIHLRQAGKFQDVRGIVLGDFPDCTAPIEGSPSVRDVCWRILGPLGVPVVFGAAVGHTTRPMLTLPLGVRARLQAKGEGTLEILEPAVLP